MLIDVIIMQMMHMTIVQIIGVSVVRYCDMSALCAMGMRMRTMLFAHRLHRTYLRC
jgi:hypothetical protein